MEVAEPEARVIGVPWDAARLGLALDDDDARDAEPPERGRRGEPGGPASDDDDVGALAGDAGAAAHREPGVSERGGTPSSSAIVVPRASATSRATRAPQ